MQRKCPPVAPAFLTASWAACRGAGIYPVWGRHARSEVAAQKHSQEAGAHSTGKRQERISSRPEDNYCRVVNGHGHAFHMHVCRKRVTTRQTNPLRLSLMRPRRPPAGIPLTSLARSRFSGCFFPPLLFFFPLFSFWPDPPILPGCHSALQSFTFRILNSFHATLPFWTSAMTSPTR